MSVLSFSDIQYIGERSPGTKPVEDILEEPTLVKVECPLQEAEDKLSLAILDKKQILSEVDYVRHVPGNYQSNDNHGETDTTREPNYTPQRPIGEPQIGIHSVEKALPKVDFSQHWQGDEKLNNNHEGSASFPKTDSLNLVGDNLSNVEEEIYKEELGHLRIAEMHSFACSKDNEKGSCLGEEQGVHVIDSLFESNNCALPNEDGQSHKTNRKESVDSPCNAHTILNKGNCLGEEQGVHAIDSLFESNHCVLPKEDGHRYQINKGKEHVDSPRNADCILSNTSNFPVEDGYKASILHELSDLACRADFELGNLPAQVEKNKHLSASGNSHQLLEIMLHAGRDNNQEGESGLPGTEYLEQDHTVALWVKWRGKWQTGIRCSRADCPLPTLRAKPTHERKKYIAVYFPRTRTYSWADMLLVCSIDESPEPLVYGTHRRWRKWVKDLSVARRYIMQKLAVAMLNISDQLHTEAVIENARKATTWKEFAKEASCCRDYSDLGRILLKLQTMILPWYISHDWLENSFDSWVQRCQIAQSAESIEILTEELVESVLWTEVDELWNAPVQPELGTEWKTWKQEAMKWFFTSHPTANCGDVEHKNSDNSMAGGSQVSRKRPKLEVRRAETCASQMEASSSRVLSEPNYADTNSGYFNCQGILESASSCDPKFIQSPAVGTSAGGGSGKTTMVNAHRELDTTNKSRQCSAFIEAKGRQCGRWANDGDIYCCVHLNARTVGKPSQEKQMLPLESPMCEGMTTHGNKCKHRARYGSQFCKKHRLQRSHDSINTDNFLISSGNKLKRKHEEDKIWENKSCSNTVDGQELRLVEVQNLIPIMVGETLDKRNPLMKKSELHNALPSPLEGSCPDSPCCIGNYSQSNSEKCLENAKRHTLYCEKHLPKFLKRARNGKSRLVSKDVFIYLLRNCYSRKQKLHLHQACDLLYGFMKSNLSGQKPVSKGDIMDWILSEASKDLSVGEYLLKLVSSEREKITRLWGFDEHIDMQTAFSETNAVSMLEKCEEDHGPEMIVKCKICNEGFCDDQKLGAHWTEFHKKEGRWLFRGYACAVCMNSFTNRKVLEAHVKDRHGVQFLEHSILFRCMSCNSHFVNLEQLWKHVLSFHLTEFRMPNVSQQHNHTIEQPVQPKLELGNRLCQNNDGSEDSSQRYICRLCGLKFDLLPDLGRHHQVAHMNPVSVSHFPPKRGDHRLKRSRHCHPGFKKSFSTAFRFKNQSSFGMRTHFQSSNSLFSVRPGLQTQASETVALGSLLESHCSDVAETLFSQIQKTKPRPSNLEILSIARSACCRISLSAALVVKYGILPENLYLKAAKLCSELNIQVDWHNDGFICPKGCRPLTHPHSLDPLNPLPDEFVEPLATPIINDSKWDMDECHYILQPEHFNWKLRRKTILLCEDVSFGKESVPVACVLDEDFKNSHHIGSDEASDNQVLGRPMPWQSFTYVTERLIGQSHGLDTKNSQLGCACPHPKCYPENCDHVYLFDNDYENAVDIHGKSMRGRFPYDERGRIVLEEGHLVYECNSTCNCDSTCHNRVLQKGVQVKLEIFSTEKKGWAVRAGEAITRGTFVCEYLGEVLNDVEANRRGESYLYDIDAHIDGARGWSEGAIPYVIDATKYGNVSRFINHSCSPNLVNYLVLVESMDCQLAHIGLYASRDIAAGEELAYDYCHKLLPGDGHPCHCGAPNCRGRLY